MRKHFASGGETNQDEIWRESKGKVVAFLTTIVILSLVIVVTVAILPAYTEPSEDAVSNVTVTADSMSV